MASSTLIASPYLTSEREEESLVLDALDVDPDRAADRPEAIFSMRMTNVHCNKVTITCFARRSLPLLVRSGQHAGVTRIGEPRSSAWVVEQRHRLRIPDRYGNVPDAPRVSATVADGRPAIVTLSPRGWKLELPPSSRSGVQDEALQITVSVDDEAEYIAKKIKRFERDNPGFTWKTTKREVSPRVPLDVSFPFSMPMTLWPRFAVKVALTVGRELYGEQWLHSDHGMLLNRLLWGREEKIGMNPLPTKQAFWAPSGWTPPPDHVVIVIDGYNGPMVLITLFGEDSYAVPLGDAPPPGVSRGCCTRVSARGTD